MGMIYKLRFYHIAIFFLYCTVFFSSCASSTSSGLRGSQDTLLNNLGAEYYFLAEEYLGLEQYDKALELFLKVLNTGAKTTEEMTFKIARTAALAKNWELALENYKALLVLDANNLAIAKSIAWIYAQQGDIELSRLDYAALYAVHSYDKEICTNYILVLLALDLLDEAKTVFTAYEELYPEAENLEELHTIFLSKEDSVELEDENLNQGEESSETQTIAEN